MFLITVEELGPGGEVEDLSPPPWKHWHKPKMLGFTSTSSLAVCLVNIISVFMVSVSFVIWCSKCKMISSAREMSGKTAVSITLVSLILNYNNSTCTAHVPGVTKIMRKSNWGGISSLASLLVTNTEIMTPVTKGRECATVFAAEESFLEHDCVFTQIIFILTENEDNLFLRSWLTFLQYVFVELVLK